MPALPSPATPRTPGRPRSTTARLQVLATTRKLLTRLTFDELSVDAIAEQSGVAKTTIYRTWPSKAAIAVDAFLAVVDEAAAISPEPTLRGSIRRQLRLLAKLYRTEIGRFFKSVVGAAQSDPVVAEVLWNRFILNRRAYTHEAFQRAIAGGEVRPCIDVEVAMDLVYGPVFYRLMLTGSPPTDAKIDAQLDLLFNGVAPSSSAPSQTRAVEPRIDTKLHE